MPVKYSPGIGETVNSLAPGMINVSTAGLQNYAATVTPVSTSSGSNSASNSVSGWAGWNDIFNGITAATGLVNAYNGIKTGTPVDANIHAVTGAPGATTIYLPPPPPEPKSNTGTIVIIAVVALIIGLMIYLLTRNTSKAKI